MSTNNGIVWTLFLVGTGYLGLGQAPLQEQNALNKRKEVMLMNRIGPSASELYISNADGTSIGE